MMGEENEEEKRVWIVDHCSLFFDAQKCIEGYFSIIFNKSRYNQYFVEKMKYW